ncbi:hypothetical protein HDU93_005432 [Gonapodya sp. JEL0774]|nr:hypothetical protein HDU93_005432 [Gonapodya sp. JEL0774]
MKLFLLALVPLLTQASPVPSLPCDRAVGCVDFSPVADLIPILPVGRERNAALLPLKLNVYSDVPRNLVVEASTEDGLYFLGKSHVHRVSSSAHPVPVAVDLARVCAELTDFLEGTVHELKITLKAWLTADDPNTEATVLTEVKKNVVVTRPVVGISTLQQHSIMETDESKMVSPLIKRQRSCDTIHAAYAAGTAMVYQDFLDWYTWKCNTWYPGGIGRSCDSIFAAYTAGVAMVAQDYSDWSAWKCSTWHPSGIGSGGSTPPPPPPPPTGSSPCANAANGCVDTSSFPTSISATAGGGGGYTFSFRASASTQKDVFVEFRKNGVIVSNYAYASLAASTSWTTLSVTLTYPTQTVGGTYQFFVWLTAPGKSWAGQTYNTLLSVTLSGGSSPPPPPPPPPSGRGGSAAGAYITTCKTPGMYALTFDDGPYIYTAGLKSILAQYGIKATFFVNGNNWASIYDYGDLLRDSVNQGHQIAMHGWSHCDFLTPATCPYYSEIDQLMTAIQSIIGRTPSYFRFPYGDFDSAAQNYVASKGLRIVGWNLDTEDWTDANKANPTLSLNNVQNALNAVDSSYATFIPLEHDVWPTTAGATSNSWIWAGLSFIQSKGYRFVTVAECDGDPSGGYF